TANVETNLFRQTSIEGVRPSRTIGGVLYRGLYITLWAVAIGAPTHPIPGLESDNLQPIEKQRDVTLLIIPTVRTLSQHNNPRFSGEVNVRTINHPRLPLLLCFDPQSLP